MSECAPPRVQLNYAHKRLATVRSGMPGSAPFWKQEIWLVNTSCWEIILSLVSCRKVAWQELSLECPGSRETSPGGVDCRPQSPEMGNFTTDSRTQSRLDFVKTFVNPNTDNNNLVHYKERYNQTRQSYYVIPIPWYFPVSGELKERNQYISIISKFRRKYP